MATKRRSLAWLIFTLLLALMVAGAMPLLAQDNGNGNGRGNGNANGNSNGNGNGNSNGNSNGNGGGRNRVPICHATSSPSNPYELITVSEPALDSHAQHGDIIPAPAGGCPNDDNDPEPVEPVECPTGFQNVLLEADDLDDDLDVDDDNGDDDDGSGRGDDSGRGDNDKDDDEPQIVRLTDVDVEDDFVELIFASDVALDWAYILSDDDTITYELDNETEGVNLVLPQGEDFDGILFCYDDDDGTDDDGSDGDDDDGGGNGTPGTAACPNGFTTVALTVIQEGAWGPIALTDVTVSGGRAVEFDFASTVFVSYVFVTTNGDSSTYEFNPAVTVGTNLTAPGGAPINSVVFCYQSQ